LGAALQIPQLTSSGSDTLGELLPGTLMLGMALDARKFAKVEGAKSNQGHKNCTAWLRQQLFESSENLRSDRAKILSQKKTTIGYHHWITSSDIFLDTIGYH
jgi:hypothetical protein